MRSADRSTPQYLDVLVEHLKEAPARSVLHIEVRHDDDCKVFVGRPCDCEPEVESGARVDRKYGGEVTL